MPTRRARWASWRALRATWGRFPDDWASTPAEARHRWAWTLAAGFAAAAAVTAALLAAAVGLEDRGLGAWDERVLRALLAAPPFSFAYGVWLETWGNDAFIVPVVLGGLYATLRAGRPFRALSLLVGYVGMKVFILGPWLVWARPRPDLVAGGVASPGFHAFPSGHAINATVILGLLTAWWVGASRSRLEQILAVATLTAVLTAVNLSRLRLGVHWPSDALAGTAIGLVWLTALLLALRQAEKPYPTPPAQKRPPTDRSEGNGSRSPASRRAGS